MKQGLLSVDCVWGEGRGVFGGRNFTVTTQTLQINAREPWHVSCLYTCKKKHFFFTFVGVRNVAQWAGNYSETLLLGRLIVVCIPAIFLTLTIIVQTCVRQTYF